MIALRPCPRYASALLWLLLGCTSVFADGWTGVWRLVLEEDSAEPKQHLVCGPDLETRGALLYRADWTVRRMRVAELGDDRLVLEYRSAPGRPFDLVLSSRGSGLAEGRLELRHVQFSHALQLVGRKVLGSGDWDPAAVTTAGDEFHLIDLNNRLVSAAAEIPSPEAFARFWQDEIAPDYYHLFEDFLYPETGLEPDSGALEAMWNLLREPDYRRAAERFPLVRKEFVSAFRERFPALLYETPLVAMPALDRFDLSILRIGEMIVLRVGVDRLRGVKEEKLRAWLAREQFKLPIYAQISPWDSSLPARIVREGLAVHLAVEGGLAASPEDCFLEPIPPVEATDLGASRAELSRALRSGTVPELDPPAILALGLAFADRVVTAYGPEKALTLSQTELSGLLRDFALEAEGS
jgi:hypothetical protein